jgi:hypothetical protein
MSDVMNKTNQGKQTLIELTSALVHTKELFREAATTRIIMEKLRKKKFALPKGLKNVETNANA